jgi:hypothetical protein
LRFAQALWSGQLRSLSEITVTGSGHAIDQAGSSYRTPVADAAS